VARRLGNRDKTALWEVPTTEKDNYTQTIGFSLQAYENGIHNKKTQFKYNSN
jgi:hypothetical protein